ALAAELGPNTRVNGLAPGFRKSIEDKTLLNGLGTVEGMGSAAAFLASDDAAYITGETLVIAGGMPSRL
ncbi:Short-chain dehydrogenase/reductase SDRA-like protein, partial [Drosera capensis]